MYNPQKMIESLEAGLATERLTLLDSQKARRDYLAGMLGQDAGFELDDFVRYDGSLHRVTGFVLAKEHKQGVALELTDHFDERKWLAYPELVDKVTYTLLNE